MEIESSGPLCINLFGREKILVKDKGVELTDNLVSLDFIGSGVNATAQENDITVEIMTPTAADVGAVPTTRTVNSKALSENITLSAADVGAEPAISINSLTDKATPEDADPIIIEDSANAFVKKKLTWANLKETSIGKGFSDNSVVYVDVLDGNDSTGTKNDSRRRFKTFEAAYAASDEWGVIKIIQQRLGGSGILNSTNAITINKGILVVNDSFYSNKGPTFTDCKITINMTTRRPVYFRGISFQNISLDDYNIDVINVTDHPVQFDDCYLVRTTGTKNIVHTTGAWLNSGSTGSANSRAAVIFNRCNHFGGMLLEHGVIGDPFALKGQVIINDIDIYSTSSGASPTGIDITINSGPVFINNNNRCRKITLNGGLLQIRNSDFPTTLILTSPAITANAVDAVGKSYLIVEDMSMLSPWRNPMTVAQAGMGRITIGANVLYSIKGMLIPNGNVVIDANAKEYHTYLAAQGKTTSMVNYNSMPVYQSGASIPKTAADMGAVPTTRTVNSKALSADIALAAADVGAQPADADLTAIAALTGTGGYAKRTAADTWTIATPSAADVGAVPTTRTVNSKALSSDIVLTAADVGAATADHAHGSLLTYLLFYT